MLVREILEIADNTSGDVTVIENEDGSTSEKVNQEVVNRAKLRVDARKWLAARLAPKKWGDRLAHEHVGPDGRPIPAGGGVVILQVSEGLPDAGNRRAARRGSGRRKKPPDAR